MSGMRKDQQQFFPLNVWPDPKTCLVLGLQWLVILMPTLLVLGQVVSRVQGLAGADQIAFLQRLLLVSAVIQLGQVLFGHRLPGQVGPSAVLMVGVIGTVSAGPAAIYGAMMVGGGLACLVGLTGLAGKLGRLFTRPVLASILILIAVTLAPVTKDLLFHPTTRGGGATSFVFGLALVMVMLLAQARLKGLWSSAVPMLGMIIGSVFFHSAALLPGGPQMLIHPGLMSLPDITPHAVEFKAEVILPFLLCYLAVMSNELATVETLGHVIGAPHMKKRRTMGVGLGGLGGVLGGILGVPGTVTYSSSPAVVISTKNASRFTIIPAVAGLGLLAFWPGGLGLFSMMPQPVVGALLLFLTANGIFAAINILAGEGGYSWRHGVIVGFTMVAGICVAFMPAETKQALHPWFRPLLTNGFVVGLILALIMDLVLPGREVQGDDQD